MKEIITKEWCNYSQKYKYYKTTKIEVEEKEFEEQEEKRAEKFNKTLREIEERKNV